MKRMAFTVILILIGLPTLFAQNSAQATFDQANTLFEEGAFYKALNSYRQIENSGQVSGALYLNMGIVSVEIDSMGLAKYYFLKATNYETTETEANKALEYVENQFSRQSAILPKLPWDRAVHWMNNVPGASLIFIIGFMITLSGLILLISGWYNKITLDKVFPYMLTLIIIGSTIAGSAFYADYVEQRYDEAVLVTQARRVLQQPNEESGLISIAYEGYDLTVDNWQSAKQEDWLYIRLGNGQFGWVKKEGIKRI